MIRAICVVGVASLIGALSAGAQGAVPADSIGVKAQHPLPAPQFPACRAGAYPESDGGPGPLYVTGDLLVGGDSTVAGYIAKMPIYVQGGDVDRVDVIKGPAAVALYGCRARQGAIRIELKPEVKLRPEWQALSRTPAPAAPKASAATTSPPAQPQQQP